jgi:hypothetical protein
MAKRRRGKGDALGAMFRNLSDAMKSLNVDLYKEAGDYVRDRIVSKARQGKTMADGTEKDLAPLNPDYVVWREHLEHGAKGMTRQLRREAKKKDKEAKVGAAAGKAAVGVDPKFFSPNRSNLTLTGQYLESIEVTNINAGRGEITIEPTGDRKKGGPQWIESKKKPPSNKKLAGYLAKMGRSIFGLDETGRKVLLNKVKRKVRDSIKKNLRK